MRRRWQFRLARHAQDDFAQIVSWTAAYFGVRQARIYAATLRRGIQALEAGMRLLDMRQRPELGVGVATLHVARQGRKGRHVLVFRVDEQAGVIDVLRILHDSMDLERHLEA